MGAGFLRAVRGAVVAVMALAGAVTVASTGARAQSLASFSAEPGIVPKAEARPIVAWVAFCESYPAECAVNRAEPVRIALTPAIWNTIVSVNRRINIAIEPMTDADHLHVADRWDLAEDGIGDCEDYQLLKRHMLAEAGLPRRAMRMTVVIDEKGEGHAVLTLLTDRGDLVLDNKTDTILPWHRTGYVFIKRESQDVVGWVSLGGATSPVTTANR